MRLLVCMLLPLIAWGAPADLTKEASIPEESLKLLIRTKRADEEIMFGNHQNEARVVKKSDPSLQVVNEDSEIDNGVDPSGLTEKGDVITKGDDSPNVNAIFSDDAQSVGDMTKGDVTAEDPLEEGESPSAGDEEKTEKDEDVSSGEIQDEENMIPSKDYKDYYDYFYPYVGMRRFRRSNIKQKRAAAPENFLTAEDMTSQARANQRVKRDLTADELYDWLENGDSSSALENAPSVGYYPEYETEDVEGDDRWKDGMIEQIIEQEEEEYPEEQDRLPDYSSYQDYGEEEADNPELLSLLEYLVENESPAQEVNPLGELYPEDIQEKWEDLDLDPEVTYQPIIYQGVPGIFIPMDQKLASRDVGVQKRQYLSMMPGLKKRNWYPYSTEPKGGRWGAFVTPEEEKRTADAYERLYRLAEALNPQDRDYVDYK